MLVPGNYKFRRISPEGGLGTNGLRDVRQDQWGFVWIITVNDLFRFDGYTFKRYTNVLPKSDYHSNWSLNQLAIDSDGIVHVASSSGGLLAYNPFSDSFDRVFDEDTYLIRKDSKNRLWICTSTIGIFDQDNHSFTAVKSSGKIIEQVSAIYEESLNVYIGTRDGELYRLNEAVMEFEQIPADMGKNIVDIVRLDSSLYVLTEHEGLYVVNLDDNRVTRCYTFFYPNGDTRVAGRRLHKDKAGMI